MPEVEDPVAAPITPPPCSRCEQPCREIYNQAGRERWPINGAPWQLTTAVIWLCADCVDEIVEALA